MGRTGAIAILTALACGPEVGDASETSTSATASESAEASSGAPSCEMYQPAAEIGPAVAITVRHDGTLPVFFRPVGCGGAIAVDVFSAGVPVPWRVDDQCFPNTCDGFVASGDCGVGCNDCAPPEAGRIDVGVTTESSWPGQRLTELELLSACAPGSECPATCVRPDQAEPGSYDVALTIYRTCTGTCVCDAPVPSTCGLWSGEQLADPHTYAVTIDYPAQTAAEIVITDG